MDDRKYAVLIDSDNVSAKYISYVLDEMTKYGTATIRRIYGDWTSQNSGRWKNELAENSITPIQQFANTVGKNATDSTLIIDAMDILYSNNVDGFCIVSSDGDFTRLASRLRESGMDVIGMGESKTPKSFRAGCSVFTDLELLLDQDDETKAPVRTKKNVVKQTKIENAIVELITENDNNGRETSLCQVGTRLQNKYSDFDVRNYGYSSLSKFIDDIDAFTINKQDNQVTVALRDNDNFKDKIVEFVIENIKKSGETGMELGALGQKIHDRYPNFKVKEFGYSTLSKFVSVIKSLRIEDSAENRKYVKYLE